MRARNTIGRGDGKRRERASGERHDTARDALHEGDDDDHNDKKRERESDDVGFDPMKTFTF